MTSRRDLIKAEAMAAMAGAVPSSVTLGDPMPEQHKLAARTFWPDGARMVISVSMQMEAGAQPASGAESPMPRIDSKYGALPGQVPVTTIVISPDESPVVGKNHSIS